MPGIINGGIIAGGGNAMSAEQVNTLKYFKYDAGQRRLIANRPIQTTVDSIHLGGVHSMSSGHENIWFHNQHSHIHWNPLWQGLREQKQPNNQDGSGIIHSTSRKYSQYMLDGSLGSGSALPDPVATVPYATGTTLGAENLSVYGVRFQLAQALTVGQVMHYHLHEDDANGVIQYRSIMDITEDYAIGDFLELWFSNPDESMAGETVFAELLVESAPDVDDLLTIEVYADANDNTRHWAQVRHRTFEDQYVALLDDTSKQLGGMEIEMSESLGHNLMHDKWGQLITWITGDYMSWPEPAEYWDAATAYSKNDEILSEDSPGAGYIWHVANSDIPAGTPVVHGTAPLEWRPHFTKLPAAFAHLDYPGNAGGISIATTGSLTAVPWEEDTTIYSPANNAELVNVAAGSFNLLAEKTYLMEAHITMQEGPTVAEFAWCLDGTTTMVGTGSVGGTTTTEKMPGSIRSHISPSIDIVVSLSLVALIDGPVNIRSTTGVGPAAYISCTEIDR